MQRVFRKFVFAVMMLGVSACASYGPVEQPAEEVARLEAALVAMGPDIDPAEAARAARIALSYPSELAVRYQITDPPLIHNTKVNMGLRPRGLCWHWAEDMENRLNAENFKTLDVLRAIANGDNAFLIDHSTALLAPRGGTLKNSVVLDPWRFGGRLYWGQAARDPSYDWQPQAEVLAAKRRAILARRGAGSVVPAPG